MVKFVAHWYNLICNFIMIVNNKKLVLFIHIPKTGGCSVKELFLDQNYENKFEMWHSSHPKLFNIKEHIDVNKYFKFCVVRNPYDRFVSHYKHQCSIHRAFKRYKGKKVKFDEIGTFLKEFTILKYNNIQINEGYNDEMDINLLTAMPNYKLFCKYLEYIFFTLNHEERNNFILIGQQSNFVCIGNKIAVDYIVKFENLENEIKFIMEKFNLEGNLQFKNVSVSSNEKYEIPDKYKDMLYEFFKDDFINFNYDK